MIPILQKSLIDLLYEIRESEIKLIICGGLSIYLKYNMVRNNKGLRTFLETVTESRSTSDIDIFLKPEFLIDSEKLMPLAKALEKLGYSPIKGAEKYQFIKELDSNDTYGNLKLDFLTAPKSSFIKSGLKVDDRRVRPKPSIGLHAHPIDEAFILEIGLISVEISGNLSSGEKYTSEVYIPHPYNMLIMKLFAFKDRCNDKNCDYGRHHALDLYTILSCTTEEEWKSALELQKKYRMNSTVIETANIVDKYFCTTESLGILRIKENPYSTSEFQFEKFISALKKLFLLRDD